MIEHIALGFPLWLRITHYLNIIFTLVLVRSGLQIFFDHPKLYWNDSSTPGSEWFSLARKKMPAGALWTSRDEAEYLNPVVGITGGEHKLGSARRWHFTAVILWLTNGFVYLAFLFTTGEWVRLVPTSWSIFPGAIRTMIEYMHFQAPSAAAFNPYDPLQQLTYFMIIFVLSPIMIITGLAMSPAFTARFPKYLKIFGGRQSARSIHFLGMVAMLGFVAVHVTMVILVNAQANLLNITIGDPAGNAVLAGWILAIAITLLLLINIFITLFTRSHERVVQQALDPLINGVTGFFFGRAASHQRYTKKDISPYFRVNGRPPENPEWVMHRANGFANWKLKVKGLVENPMALSLADLKAMRKSEQITKHNCIQGWSAVAEWGGVLVGDVMLKVKPKPEARYAVFFAYDEDPSGHPYYETFPIEEMLRPQALLAYEMNYEALKAEHGAPLRLRAETKLGFKMVKYLRSIYFVESVSSIGLGYGGSKEDLDFYDKNALI